MYIGMFCGVFDSVRAHLDVGVVGDVRRLASHPVDVFQGRSPHVETDLLPFVCLLGVIIRR